ncbi:MAG: PDZ domain-containing protein [Candidatus Pristimantibacillus lignocellulolyticus]|uniref:PDZ domain-containing protein n=1 Tax=Candidatus Pristimantibacillus lignocellulolyticus TaxID=2994561 RepID=A0A9J6ZJ37_9BACL|nr:MAG: PDZ domain-containing protein [Candidatus Pristimantibacillus lignocellulolyticus]
MGDIELWLQVLGKALVSLLIQPLFYISLMLLLTMFLYRVRMERSMFSVKLKEWKLPMVFMILGGLVAAILVSVIAAVLGFTLTVPTIYWLWFIMLILTVFKVRFLTISYSAGIVAILHLIASVIGPLSLQNDLAFIYQTLLDINAFSLLVISALLGIAQSVLVRIQHKHMISPVYMSGKRGKVIGGYVLQGYWPIPLLLFMPVTPEQSGAFLFNTAYGQPFFMSMSNEAWLMLACPLMIGVTQLTQAVTPKQLALRVSRQGLLVSCVLLLISIGSWWVSGLIWVSAILTLIASELLNWYNNSQESKQTPLYGQDNNGLKVLAVVKSSPAEQMNIEIGDIIIKANGQDVHTLEQLYEAMSINPAFCKLALLNNNRDLKFAQRTRYADEHHQLGIILAPDEQAKYLAKYKEPSLFTWLGRTKLLSKQSAIIAESSSTSVT